MKNYETPEKVSDIKSLIREKTRSDVINDEYFSKAAGAVFQAIDAAYKEGYHTGWMKAARFYNEKYKSKCNDNA